MHWCIHEEKKGMEVMKDMDRKIILASQSPRRIQLLQQIGIDAEVRPSHLEECIHSSDPAEVVRELALQKAGDIAAQYIPAGENGASHTEENLPIKGPVVIGADTVVAVDGKILGKPKDHEEAYEMIRMIAGRKHQVFTGVAVVHDGKAESFVEKTDVHVYEMSDAEIRAYADSEEPMDKAGAYGIQGAFGKFIRGIEGDYNTVVGLPVAHLYQVLKTLA